MKFKFGLTALFGTVWLMVSTFLGIFWASSIPNNVSALYTWWVIIGIALLPGFLMSMLFFSNILHWKLKTYPNTEQNVTILMCAYNEQATIEKAIKAICRQKYLGNIRLIVIDNGSTDETKQKIKALEREGSNCSVEYTYCEKTGKAYALNHGLSMVNTPYFLTVDADTYLEQQAVQKIMNHIVYKQSACVAANLFVNNANQSFITKIQTYDYFLSIAAVKRFQGAYNSTLVAQGAFSAYETKSVQEIGGWKPVLGEDIVLTYELLQKGKKSTYEPAAVGYTTVPTTLNGLYNQRKRWAIGMLEGLSEVPPWRQGGVYPKFFTYVNLCVVYLDLAFLFGFIPGLILACIGCQYFVGICTLFTFFVGVVLYMNMYLYQKKLGVFYRGSVIGFVGFLILFQLIQSVAALHGYFIRLFHRKEQWK